MASPDKPVVLEIFSDYVCPWCYLATRRIERLHQSYSLELKWICFPLHPDTPAEGLALETLLAGQNIDLTQAMARLRAVAEAEGLPFGHRTRTYNSRLAQELGKWAEENGRGPEFRRAAFEAYFAQGRNLARTEVLAGLAEAVDLDPDQAREVLEERAYALAVEEDYARAGELEVVAVPTFLAGGRTIVGAQPYETMEALVKAAGAVRRR